MPPDATKIFGPYWNGAAEVYADPLSVYRRLVSALEGEPNRWLQAARDPDPLKRSQAWERLLPAAVAALGMVPFDPATGGGATEQDIRAALTAYLEWVRSKKASGPRPATWSPPTAHEWRRWQDDPSTTPPTAACGSTSDASGGGGPGK